MVGLQAAAQQIGEETPPRSTSRWPSGPAAPGRPRGRCHLLVIGEVEIQQQGLRRGRYKGRGGLGGRALSHQQIAAALQAAGGPEQPSGPPTGLQDYPAVRTHVVANQVTARHNAPATSSPPSWP